jgi:anti-anti-sigma factor
MSRIASFALREEAPEAGTFVIVVEGEADMTTAVKFNESFFSAARSGTRRVVADLTGVDFIDTTMLNALLVGHRRMVRDHGRFAVVCNGSLIGRVLDVTGLDQILAVFATRDEAFAHIHRAG